MGNLRFQAKGEGSDVRPLTTNLPHHFFLQWGCEAEEEIIPKMNKPAALPVEGIAIRFAPGLGLEPAVWFWKFWTQGSEVYAVCRNPLGMARISVHKSGQIHFRLGTKVKQNIAPLSKWGLGPWFHAFEMRFLLSDGTNVPPDQRKLLKKKKLYVIPVPKGFIPHFNLLIGDTGTPLGSPVPHEFSGQVIWRTLLRDGRPAVLVGRMLKLDDQNRGLIRYYRETLDTTVKISNASKAYFEYCHFNWSPTAGNVILVIPMGDEVIRYEQEVAPPNHS